VSEVHRHDAEAKARARSCDAGVNPAPISEPMRTPSLTARVLSRGPRVSDPTAALASPINNARVGRRGNWTWAGDARSAGGGVVRGVLLSAMWCRFPNRPAAQRKRPSPRRRIGFVRLGCLGLVLWVVRRLTRVRIQRRAGLRFWSILPWVVD